MRAAGEYLSDPAVQIVNDPVGVLEISPTAEAAAVLLDKFAQTDSEPVFDAAVTGIAYKVSMGQYSKTELDRIEATLVRAMHHRTREIGGLEEVMVVMPEGAQSRLMDASRGLRGHQELATVAAHGEWARPEVAKRVIAADGGPACAPSFPRPLCTTRIRMTPRIIREALFSARGEHRHHSSLVLLGSPFRALAGCGPRRADRHAAWEEPILQRMMQLLRYLVGEAQEAMLLSWIPNAEQPMLRDMVLSLGHLPASGADLSPLVARLGEDDAMLDRAILYGLGMRRDPSLATLANDPSGRPPCGRRRRWWLRQGGAVLE